MSSTEKWSDLTTRVGSGVAMVLVGAVCILMGGLTFHVLVAVICGLMVWELVGMLRVGAMNQQGLLGAIAGASILSSGYLGPALSLALILVPVIVGYILLEQHRPVYVAFTLMILLSGIGLMLIRDDMGGGWMLWLAVVVVITDVVGYFAGRAFGGPKFWPAISPKKTWSGTAAGWVGAAIVGAVFSINTGTGMSLVWISVLVAMASQLGDIAESALKRKTGVKDSSNLIPGHGGLMDRFDGMLGASVFVLFVIQFIGFPAGLG
jgi:phosphatidate cytidylyltransferase